MTDPEFPYGAKVGWSRMYNSELHWNELCAWSVETFGLPGQKFITDTDIDQMTWWFVDPADRAWFCLRYGHATCTQLPLAE